MGEKANCIFCFQLEIENLRFSLKIKNLKFKIKARIQRADRGIPIPHKIIFFKENMTGFVVNHWIDGGNVFAKEYDDIACRSVRFLIHFKFGDRFSISPVENAMGIVSRKLR